MTDLNSVNTQELRQYIERIERAEEEMDAAKSDRKDIYSEVKAVGYDTKAVRKIVRLRKMDKMVRDEEELILDTYKSALGL